MIHIQQSIVIYQPVTKVFAFLTNAENETQWQAGLIEAKFTSAGPVGVGTTGRDLRQFMGRPIETTWKVTEFERDQKMAFSIVTGPIPFQGSYAFRPVENGTELIFTAWAETKGFSRLFDPLVNWNGKKQYERDLATLKQVLEGKGQTGDAAAHS